MNCKKCGDSIPSRTNISGILRPTSDKRIHCFNCVPFVSRKNKVVSGDCVCGTCGREYVYERNKGHTKSRCNSCAQAKRRHKLKNELVEYKGGCCSECGYNKCVDALDFHHTDPHEKELLIGSSWNRSLKILKNEADKCILLCANCHREIHSSK